VIWVWCGRPAGGGPGPAARAGSAPAGPGPAALGVAVASMLVIAADIARGYRQKMWIMNVIYPVTAPYWGPVALRLFFAHDAMGFQCFTIALMRGLSKERM
jgi:hypothetical protein